MNDDYLMYTNVNPVGMEMPMLGMLDPMPEMALPQAMQMPMPTMSVMPTMNMPQLMPIPQMMPCPCMEMAHPHPQPPMGVSPLYEISNELRAALRELMEIDFALIELNLYLNTHPTDATALAQHNRYSAMRPAILRRVEALYGPITPMSPMGYPWTWINEPWPWKIRY